MASIWEESLLRILFNHYPDSVQLQIIYKEMKSLVPPKGDDIQYQHEIRDYLDRLKEKGKAENVKRGYWRYRSVKETESRMKFKDEVEEFIKGCLENKPLPKRYKLEKRTLKCDSGNPWKPDIVIVDSTNSQVKLVGEIKIQQYSEGNRSTLNTYLEHMWRAGARFCDVKNHQVPKYLLFPYTKERPKGFDFDAYFRRLDVTLLDWSKIEHREMLRRAIKQL